MFDKHNITKSFFVYLTITLMLIIAPGSLIYIQYPNVILSLFILTVFILNSKYGSIVIDSSLLYLVGLCFLMVMTSLSNKSFDNEFIRYIIYGLMTYILLGSLTLQQFKLKFLNVVSLFSLISIIIFFTYIIFGLPLSLYGENGSNGVTVGAFLFHPLEWNNKFNERNSSIFTEPGCFQYCLNFALLLYFDDIVNKKISKQIKKKLLIIVFALITCASTTGFLVLSVLLFFFFLKLRTTIVKKILIAPIMVLTVFFIYSSDSISTKLDAEEENLSYLSRVADATAMINMIQDKPLLGNGGVNTNNYLKRIENYGAINGMGLSNGLLVGTTIFGLFWPIMYCYFCMKACRKICKTIPPLVLVLILLLIHSNEFYVFSPLTYVFLFSYRRDQYSLKTDTLKRNLILITGNSNQTRQIDTNN